MTAAAVPPTAPAGAPAFVQDALARAHRDGGARVAVVTVPAPIAPLEAFVAACAGTSWRVWAPPEGPQIAGAGEAISICAEGGDALERLREHGARALARTRELRAGEIEAPPPRLVGGLAFAPGLRAPEWEPLADGSFALPELGYGRDGDRAWMSAAVPIERAATPEDRARVAARVDRALEALASAPAAPAPGSPRARLASDPDPGGWRRQVEAIRARIRAGSVEKIVTARRSVVDLDATVSAAAVLARLRHRHPGCHGFGVARAGAAFVGATPERLVERRGGKVAAEALAGSIAADEASGRAESALLASAKDRGEQAIVVRAIERALAPLCVDLDVPEQPRVRSLRHVLHLETPIRGRLRAPRHVLDLVGALHPTPAVGGAPAAEALAWIAREPAPRGWYAGPVGWFDAEGDGAFAVAIRSGLLADRRAYVYAGAGIVGDSDPDAEYAETELKQRAVMGALGVAP